MSQIMVEKGHLNPGGADRRERAFGSVNWLGADITLHVSTMVSTYNIPLKLKEQKMSRIAA